MCWERCQVEKKTSFHSCFEAHSMVYDYKTNPHLISRTCAVPSPTLVKDTSSEIQGTAFV